MKRCPPGGRSSGARNGDSLSSPVLHLAFAALLLSPALLLMGCPGALDPNQMFPPSRAGGGGSGGSGGGGCDAPAMVILPTCATAVACHGPAPAFGDFRMPADPDPTKGLIGRTALFGDAACMGMPVINTSLPPDGVLFRRLAGDACGPMTRMPFDATPLTTAQIDCLKSWVTAQLGGATLDENADDTGSLAQ
jgi:hypothetical protein